MCTPLIPINQIDEKLVLPDWAPRLPLHTDLSFHAIPALSLVIDLLFFSPPYTMAFLPALALSGCIAFGYWFWIERCYQFNNFYPYPIFEMLGTVERVGCDPVNHHLCLYVTDNVIVYSPSPRLSWLWPRVYLFGCTEL